MWLALVIIGAYLVTKKAKTPPVAPVAKTVTTPPAPVVPKPTPAPTPVPVPVPPAPKVFAGLELTPWLIAAGAAADTGAAGNVPVASQAQVEDNAAWIAIDPRGKAYANGYFYKPLGADPTRDTYDYELRMMIDTPDECAAAQAVELDVQQCIGGIVYNTGLQFDFQSSQMRIWNRTGKAWVPNGQPCPRWQATVWQVVTLQTHRKGLSIYYDDVDGNTSTVSFVAPKLGLPDMMNVAIQLDGNSAGAPFRVYLDEVNFTLS